MFRTSYSYLDIKHLVLSKIDDAQNIHNPYSLSRLRFYEQYHIPLEQWFKYKYNKSPSKSDKLAFIILLSYPKQFINNATSFDEFKLFNESAKVNNSDFNLAGVIEIDFNENDDFNDDHIDCICSKNNLKKIARVENKYSHIELYIGSECIKKYKIISQDEINAMNKILEKQKERQKEINEGVPLGYYETQRLLDKSKKKETMLKKKSDKINKKIETGNYRICYLCNTSLINIKHDKDKRICNKCNIQINEYTTLTDMNKVLINNIKSQCNRYMCNNCDVPFISILSKNDYLCKTCVMDYKTVPCKMCNTIVLMSRLLYDLYCVDCECKIFNCIDCKKLFIQEIQQTNRCTMCQMCVDNKTVIQECGICKNSFARKEKDYWKTKCCDCFNSQNDTQSLTSKLCEMCNDEFYAKPSENWKTLCLVCYKTNKNMVKCSNCQTLFARLSNETWKTMCYDCYKHK